MIQTVPGQRFLASRGNRTAAIEQSQQPARMPGTTPLQAILSEAQPRHRCLDTQQPLWLSDSVEAISGRPIHTNAIAKKAPDKICGNGSYVGQHH